VWNTYGKDALKNVSLKAQNAMQNKIRVPVVAAEEDNPANDLTNDPTTVMVDTEPEEPTNPADLFVSGPVEDVDIDF